MSQLVLEATRPSGHRLLDQNLSSHDTDAICPSVPAPQFRYSHIHPKIDKYLDEGAGCQSVLFHAAFSRNHASEQVTRCREQGGDEERAVRHACKDRLTELDHAHRSLTTEADALWDDYNSALNTLRGLQKLRESLDRILNVNLECQRLRGGIPCAPERFDIVGGNLREEYNTIMKLVKEFEDLENQLNDRLKTLKETRERLLSDDANKTVVTLVNKSCLHSKPLFMPYPEVNDLGDLRKETVESWEHDLDERLQQAMTARHLAKDLCRTVENLAAAGMARLADVWRDTDNTFKEEIGRDEQHRDRMQALLQETVENVSHADDRLSSCRHLQNWQDQQLHLMKWRQSRMRMRPDAEKVADGIVDRLDDAIRAETTRLCTLRDLIDRTREQYGDLAKWQVRLNREHEVVQKKLYVERDLCMGLRRSVLVRRPDFDLHLGIPQGLHGNHIKSSVAYKPRFLCI